MDNIQDFKTYLISKSIDLNNKIRDWEELCKRVGVDPQGDRAYIAVRAYRDAISEVLQEVKSKNNPLSSSSNNRN